MTSTLKTTSAICGLVLGATGLPAMASDITLRSISGTMSLTGEYVDFIDDVYVVRTTLGDIRVPADTVTCEGEACRTFGDEPEFVQIRGSDTLGFGFMPLLLDGYAGHDNALATFEKGQLENELYASIVGDDGYGEEMPGFKVTSTGSSDAFTTLLDGRAEIGMSSRRIRANEARALRDAGGGNMVSPTQEHIVAVDSVIVVVHPDNPVQELTTAELAGIFSGRYRNWQELGGDDMPITLVVRPFQSGTREVFNDEIFGGVEAPIVEGALIGTDDNNASALVSAIEGAISYVGHAFKRGAKDVSLVNGCGLTMAPDAFSVRTEEYALQRRLYLYHRADKLSAASEDFIDYALSPDADGVIRKAGFIDLGVDRQPQSLDGDRARQLLQPVSDPYEGGVMREMLGMMVDNERLSTTFRFRTGSSSLDERGEIDMVRLIDFLSDVREGSKVTFVGFTDDVGPFDGNRDLSRDRARQVMNEMLRMAGGRLPNIETAVAGFGEVAPAGCNTTDRGRAINRRVEVWLNEPA